MLKLVDLVCWKIWIEYQNISIPFERLISDRFLIKPSAQRTDTEGFEASAMSYRSECSFDAEDQLYTVLEGIHLRRT